MLIIVYFARANKYLLVILHKIGCSSEKGTSVISYLAMIYTIHQTTNKKRIIHNKA